ncbi:Rho GTPase activating protein [Gnomoniopsis sp. IMI 355080]|nr:Rho GTPase activating protein [Gnomoniopsis sp. IMI 355080]
MPGASRMDAVKGAPRNSSIDSAISALSSGSSATKNPQDIASNPADIAKLVKAAGSPEAVIQYLLKEKNSQSQQNAQLWRLVDKQRAMILGLNKDLERSFKEKEKYRKKLKEVMSLHTPSAGAPSAAVQPSENGDPSMASAEPSATKRPALDIPASPSAGSEGSKISPVDVSMAPYPITPPADHVSNGPPSAVGEILNPEHAMPEASQHAFDQFDHDAEEREAEEEKKQTDASDDLPLNEPVPPSLISKNPSPPPQGALPALPQSAASKSEASAADDDDGLSQFPAPPGPPPRKPPPAPLQLQATSLASNVDQEDLQSDAQDEVDDMTAEKRGRRRTRHEDDEIREILALKEAEARSLSKKSKQSNSSKGTPSEAPPEIQLLAGTPTTTSPSMLNRTSAPGPTGSLAGILNSAASDANSPIRSPGLPSSPRRLPVGSGPNSPPLSPRPSGVSGLALSPREPHQTVPLPPSTPLQTPSPNDGLALKSPQPLNIVKKAIVESETVHTPTSSRESASERTRIYKGFITEEYPDLLINPDALIAVDVKVASSRMKPSRASIISLTQLEEDPVFTLAILSRADGGELWRVEKDSLSLAKLDAKLKQCPECTARTPDRSLFTGHAPARLDARRRALDQYLEEVLNTPLDRPTALELCRYFSTNVLPPNADEIGSSTGQDDDGGPRIGPGGRQYKNGYLTKRGKNFGGWKARFFVVEGPTLKYFETPGGAHLGTIKLQGAQIGRQSHHTEANSPNNTNDETDNQYRHAFLILEPKKKDPSSMTKHVLCAESDKERDLWVSVLLPWTSYKEPADEESKKAKERQEISGHVKGANAKKKMHSQSRPQQQSAKEAEDTLIGVSYETTRQGEVPTTEHAEPATPVTTMSSQPSYAISAPQNPQWIADPATFSNKMGGLAPGMDEKKAKKRSFFGFGPKQRSSSDGTDSLFSDQGGSSSPQKDGYNGPVRRVFGAPLAEAVRFNSPRDVRIALPAVVYRCIQYLEARGALNEEGIFRLSGSNVVIKALKERFDNEGDINLVEDEQYHDIHAVASMLKAYLRELPTSILTRDLHLAFVGVTEMNSQPEKVAALRDLVARLPLANLTLLRYLIAFLTKIIDHADRNKMTVRNVGIVFSPTLTIPAPVFALFLQNFELIFGASPQDFDLPSPGSASDDRSDKDSIEIPARPSTSGGMRESPHRHRLAEALAEQRRGNTPPPVHSTHPLAGFSNMRSTPTPPPVRPAYEPNPFAQQMVDMPHYVTQQRQVQQTPAYDQPYTSRASRRESSLLMSLPPRGLTPQGSSSRLREESQW